MGPCLTWARKGPDESCHAGVSRVIDHQGEVTVTPVLWFITGRENFPKLSLTAEKAV